MAPLKAAPESLKGTNNIVPMGHPKTVCVCYIGGSGTLGVDVE